MYRNDPHRPGAIVPANYDYVLSYSLAAKSYGMEVPSINVDRVVELKKSQRFVSTGSLSQCSVCGAHFTYGDIWRYKLTGEHLYVGYICAEKYALLADRSAWELENKRVRDALAKEIFRKQNEEQRDEFLKNHPGLKEELETDHPIIKDIASRFQQYRRLTDKQIQFVHKLVEEVKNPPPKENYVPAPEGRITFVGTVVALKVHDGYYGSVLKMTVKVKEREGVWLAWGTVPAGFDNVERGDEVEVTATLNKGRDIHFALMSRPRGKIVSCHGRLCS